MSTRRFIFALLLVILSCGPLANAADFDGYPRVEGSQVADDAIFGFMQESPTRAWRNIPASELPNMPQLTGRYAPINNPQFVGTVRIPAIDPATLPDHDYRGETIIGTAGLAIARGQLVYQGADFKYYPYSTTIEGYSPAGLAAADIAQNAPGFIMINGYMHESSWALPVPQTASDLIVYPATAGALTTATPSPITYVIGRLVSANTVYLGISSGAMAGCTPQTLTLGALSTMVVGDPDQAITVSASSGLSPTLTTNDSAICTISSGALHAVAPGSCTVTAAQAGDETYCRATSASKSTNICLASYCAGALVCQNFETPTTGWDNGETWVTNGTVNPAYSAAPLLGAQSLYLATGASGSYTYAYKTIAASSELYGFTRFRLVADNATGAIFNLSNNATAIVSITYNRINHKIGIASSLGQKTIAANVTYYLWWYYKAGSGSNGIIKTWISETGTKPATPDIDIETSTHTEAINRVYAYNNGATQDVIYDQILALPTEIGNICP